MNLKFLFIALILTGLTDKSFGETTKVEDLYRGSGFGGGMGQVINSPDPDTEQRPIETPPESITGGQGPRFGSIPAEHQKAPVFKKFKKAFINCAPLGCDAGRGHTYGRRSRASCHTSGDAIDLHSIICNGREYSSNHPTFTSLVRCITTQFYRGNRWKALHQDTHGHCSGVGPNTRSSLVTSCHWDHAHFSLGCMRNGRRIW